MRGDHTRNFERASAGTITSDFVTFAGYGGRLDWNNASTTLTLSYVSIDYDAIAEFRNVTVTSWGRNGFLVDSWLPTGGAGSLPTIQDNFTFDNSGGIDVTGAETFPQTNTSTSDVANFNLESGADVTFVAGASSYDSTDTVTLSGVVGGSGTLAITGYGTVLLAAANAWSGGAVTIDLHSTLQLNDPAALLGLGSIGSGGSGTGNLFLNDQFSAVNYNVLSVISGIGTFLSSALQITSTTTCYACQVAAIAEASGSDGGGASSTSTTAGCIIANGYGDFAPTASLSSKGYGSIFDTTLLWSNQVTASGATSIYGNGMAATQMPYLEKLSNGDFIFSDGSVSRTFDSSLHEMSYYGDTLTLYGDYYYLTDTSGDVLKFNDFNSSLYGAPAQGQLVSYTDAGGNVTTISRDNSSDSSSGEIYYIGQTQTAADGTETQERLVYSYETVDSRNVVETILLESGNSGWTGSPTTIASENYYYYDTGDTTYGNLGDLKLAVLNDAAGHPVDTTYYRYYTSSDDTAGGKTIGYVGGLQYMLTNDSYQRLLASVGGSGPSDVYSLTPSQISAYADVQLQYGSNQRITQLISQGTGCSVCSAGQGTYSYSYASNPTYAVGTSAPPTGQWVSSTTETLPNVATNKYYLNPLGETLLNVFHYTSGHKWLTAYTYDSSGRLEDTYNPATLSGYALLSDNTVSLTFTDGGLININDYQGSSPHYLADTAVAPSLTGTGIDSSHKIAQETFTYQSHSATIAGATVTFYNLYTDAVYGGTASSPTTETTSYIFDSATVAGVSTTYYGVNQPVLVETDLPEVSDQGGGTGVYDKTYTAYDSYGRVVAEKDAAGYITYMAYDPSPTDSTAGSGSGGMTTKIDDAQTSGLSSGGEYDILHTELDWSTPTFTPGPGNPDASGGANLTTTATYDALGRELTEIDPNGHTTTTTTIYDDSVQKEQTVVKPPAGPVVLTRIGAAYGTASAGTNTFTYDDTLTLKAGTTAPTIVLDSVTYTIESLSRSILNGAGQVIETDDYFNLSVNTFTYSASTLRIGFAWDPSNPTLHSGGNYNVTLYAYSHLGELDRQVDPNGTITRTVYDDMGRQTSVWFGTDDTPLSGYWSPNNLAGTNMVELSAYVYDTGGSGGDSNLTAEIDFPSGNSTAGIANWQVTEMAYDWQDRLVATKQGALLTTGGYVSGTHYAGDMQVDGISVYLMDYAYGETDTDTNRPITYDVLDIQGQVIAEGVYDGDGQTLSATTAPSSSSLRSLVFNDYDPQERVSKTTQFAVDQTDGLSYTLTLSGTKPTGIADFETGVIYDPNGNVAETDVYNVDPSLVYTSDAVNTQTTYFVYDGVGRQTEVIRPDPVSSGDGTITAGYLTTVTSYDPDGNVLTVTDPMGYVTTSVYDAADRLTKVTSPVPTDPGTSNPSLVTSYTYDDAGNLQSVETSLNTATFLYDALGRKTAVETTDPITNGDDGNNNTGDFSLLVTGYVYDGDGNVVSMTDPMGNVTMFQYDLLDQQTAIIQETVSATDSSGSGLASRIPQTNSVYDNLGELLSSTDPLGRTTTYKYSVLGRQIGETDPSPGAGQTSPAVTTVYDALGSVLSQTQAEDGSTNDTTSYSYDGFHHLSTVTQPSPDGFVASPVTTYQYDSVGNLLRMTDADGNTTSYAYDSLNRQINEFQKVSTDASYLGQTATTTFDYNADGDLTQKTDGIGQIVSYTYDHLNRETGEKWYNASSIQTNTMVFSYGTNGLLAAAYDSSSGYSYGYDSVGRLTSVDNMGGETNGTSGVPDVVLSYGYDADGNEIASSAAIGSTPTADFQNAYSYNTDNWLTDIAQSTQGGDTVQFKEISFSYDAAGEQTVIDRFKNTPLSNTNRVAKSVMGYDGDGRLTSLTQGNSSSSTAYANYAWQYDAANWVTSFTNSVHSPENTSYTYDHDGQLTAGAASATYSYDPAGNPTNTGDSTITSGDGNQLLADSTWSYSYDKNGNLVKQVDGSGHEVDYTYDVDNRLTEVKSYTSSVLTQDVQYTYDLYGNLIGRSVTTGGTTTTARFVFDGSEMVLAFNGSGNLTDRYLWNPAVVDQLLADEHFSGSVALPTSAGTTYWALEDNEGSVRDVVDTSGSSAEHVTYDSYGNATVASGSAVSQFLWTGKFYDSATKLQWNGGNWYNAAIGRWMSQDPLFPLSGPNGYTYGKNSPTNYRDPRGLAPEVPFDSDPKIRAAQVSLQNEITRIAIREQDARAAQEEIRAKQAKAAWKRAEIKRIVGNTPPAELTRQQLWELEQRGLAERHAHLDERGYWEELLVTSPDGCETWVFERNWGSVFGEPQWEFKRVDKRSPAEIEVAQERHFHQWVVESGEREDVLMNIVAAAAIGPVVSGLVGRELLAGAQAVGAAGVGAAQGAAAWGQAAWLQAGGIIGGLAARGQQILAWGQNLIQQWLPNCFVPGTLVSTAEGLRPIETIRKGEQVWAYDFAAQHWELRYVLETSVSNTADRLVAVSVAGEQIRSSFHHPYWVCEGVELDYRPKPGHLPNVPEAAKIAGRWVDACDLRVGDILLLNPDRRVPITAIERESYSGNLYNFHVEGLPCYAVGGCGVLVHNNSFDLDFSEIKAGLDEAAELQAKIEALKESIVKLPEEVAKVEEVVEGIEDRINVLQQDVDEFFNDLFNPPPPDISNLGG